MVIVIIDSKSDSTQPVKQKNVSKCVITLTN